MKKEILQQLVTQSRYLSKFKVKGQGLFNKTFDGWEAILIDVYSRSWDEQTDKPAMRFYPIYARRFDILHKWFEPFSFKTLRDQRSNYTIGWDGEMLNGCDYFYFLEDNSQYEKRFSLLKNEVEHHAKAVFTHYATVEDFYHYKVQPLADDEKSILPDVGADWIFIYLKTSRLVDPQNYPIIKDRIMHQIEMLYKRGEPNILEVYPNLNEAFSVLER